MSPIERSAGGGGGGGFANPMTTAGDLIFENASPAPDRLGIGLSGQALGVVGGLPAYVYPPGFEIGYAEITADANITDTSEATATALITAGPFTFDGAPVLLTFFTAALVCSTAAASNTNNITLFEGATEITRLAQLRSVITTTNNTMAISATYRFTPAAGVHTYKLCGFVSSTTGVPRITAGPGGTGAFPPAFVRFTKV